MLSSVALCSSQRDPAWTRTTQDFARQLRGNDITVCRICVFDGTQLGGFTLSSACRCSLSAVCPRVCCNRQIFKEHAPERLSTVLAASSHKVNRLRKRLIAICGS